MIVKEAFWAGYLSQKTELEKTAMSPGLSALIGGGVGAGLGAGAGYLTADEEATDKQKLGRMLAGGGIGAAGGAVGGAGLGSILDLHPKYDALASQGSEAAAKTNALMKMLGISGAT